MSQTAFARIERPGFEDLDNCRYCLDTIELQVSSGLLTAMRNWVVNLLRTVAAVSGFVLGVSFCRWAGIGTGGDTTWMVVASMAFGFGGWLGLDYSLACMPRRSTRRRIAVGRYARRVLRGLALGIVRATAVTAFGLFCGFAVFVVLQVLSSIGGTVGGFFAAAPNPLVAAAIAAVATIVGAILAILNARAQQSGTRARDADRSARLEFYQSVYGFVRGHRTGIEERMEARALAERGLLISSGRVIAAFQRWVTIAAENDTGRMTKDLAKAENMVLTEIRRDLAIPGALIDDNAWNDFFLADEKWYAPRMEQTWQEAVSFIDT